MRRLLDHVHKYHSRAQQFIASGTKQVKIVASMYDADRANLQGESLNLLHRSACLLRSTVRPGLSSQQNLIDKSIRLVFTENGPEHRNVDVLSSSSSYRRVRNLYYTKGFAELLKEEVLACGARVKTLLPQLIRNSRRGGNELTSLYPTHVSCWWPLIEDIFTSPASRQLSQRIFKKHMDTGELLYVSLDSTLKCTMPLLGQSHPLAPGAIRVHDAFQGERAIRRVLTIRGLASTCEG